MDRYCKRLIEVDLPIKRISEHARNEKNLRTGHPWHLHIWWARRPWGACRAVELASLLPAPTDGKCSEEFVNDAYKILCSIVTPKDKSRISVQESLLNFIGEYAKWELGFNTTYKAAAIDLVKAANKDGIPVVFDSFSGYGAIPGEAARLGCVSIAGELNPVALLCLTTLLEVVSKYGHELIESVKKGAEYIKKELKNKMSVYYPKHNGKDPIAWLWARTVTCEGPDCGAEIPLISQTIIAKGKRKVWVEIKSNPDSKKINIYIKNGTAIPKSLTKTAGGGHAVCPVCGFTTNKQSIKKQANKNNMGHRLYGKAIAIGHRQGKEYVDVSAEDILAYNNASNKWKQLVSNDNNIEINEKYPFHDPRAFTAGLYGIKTWGDLFTPRQKLALHNIGIILNDYGSALKNQGNEDGFVKGVITVLSLAVSNSIHYQTTMSTWLSEGMISAFITGNAIAMRWDWAEANPLVSGYVGGLDFAFEKSLTSLESCLLLNSNTTTVMKSDATSLPLPDDSADVFITDPPYYDVVPYADLSDLCYIWLKRYVGNFYPEFFSEDLTPKKEQIVVNPYAAKDGRGDQSPQHYQDRMTAALSEGRRVLKPNGIGAIVFAHKGTAAWETLLSSILDAGFIVTASWPIDTERASRMRANKSAALGSSVHIIVRPRENPDGSLRTDDIGDWRDVLSELPKRIHEWMPRLAEEGVVGADAIFACLGPALEIFSRYSSVEKASGEKVELKEYLEEVWAAVSREALNMIFKDADSSGFEEDARLTAMWLWTLKTAANGGEEESGESGSTKGLHGYSLEYDAARKIAQGLGAHLENLSHLVEIKGDTATLLSAGARTRYLFGNETTGMPKGKRKKKNPQMLLNLSGELNRIGEEPGNITGDLTGRPGNTALDQLHQSMILFAAGRGEAMKHFLVEEVVGNNPLFWKLAQALSALYPMGTDEKRWVDGILARKKGLGF